MGKNAWKLFYSRFEKQPAGDFLGNKRERKREPHACKVNITIELATAAESADDLVVQTAVERSLALMCCLMHCRM